MSMISPLFLVDSKSEENTHSMQLKSVEKKTEFDMSNIYSEVGPPPAMSESSLDFPRSGSSSKWLTASKEAPMARKVENGSLVTSADYEVPLASEKVPTLRSHGTKKPYPLTTSSQKAQLEVSNVYETPMDAARTKESRKGDGDKRTANNVNDIPMPRDKRCDLPKTQEVDSLLPPVRISKSGGLSEDRSSTTVATSNDSIIEDNVYEDLDIASRGAQMSAAAGEQGCCDDEDYVLMD